MSITSHRANSIYLYATLPTTSNVGDIAYLTTGSVGIYECQVANAWVGPLATGSGSGTVTTVSVVSTNGFAGTVANPTTTPAITLSTTITGVLKGNGTAISAATAGTDYVTASSTNTFTNKTYDTAGTGNSFSINGVAATANTGTGAVARAAGPTFTTPTLGVATATTINGNTFTTGTYTLTGVAGKTLTFNKSLTFDGTDATTMTFPSTSDTIPGLGQANVFSSAIQTVQGLTTTSPGWYAQITGDAFPRVRVGLNGTDIASLGLGSGAAARDLFLERAGVATVRWGAPDAAAPVAQIDGVQNVVAGTTNTAGAARTFKGSAGTGTGVGGSIIFQVAPAGTTGTAQNAFATALTIASDKSATLTGALTVQVGGTNRFQVLGTNTVFNTSDTTHFIAFNNAANTKTLSAFTDGGNLGFISTSVIGFNSTSNDATAALDTGIGRNAARVIEVNNGTLGTFGDLKVRQYLADQTITAGGTTGNQTINKSAGTVNIAAAGTTVTVSCSLCTTSSTVFAVLRTADATARIANVVPGAGSFVINIVATTAEVSIGFLVVNQ